MYPIVLIEVGKDERRQRRKTTLIKVRVKNDSVENLQFTFHMRSAGIPLKKTNVEVSMAYTEV